MVILYNSAEHLCYNLFFVTDTVLLTSVSPCDICDHRTPTYPPPPQSAHIV